MDQNIVILVLLLIAILVAFYSAYLALDTSKKVRKVQSDLKETLTALSENMNLEQSVREEAEQAPLRTNLDELNEFPSLDDIENFDLQKPQMKPLPEDLKRELENFGENMEENNNLNENIEDNNADVVVNNNNVDEGNDNNNEEADEGDDNNDINDDAEEGDVNDNVNDNVADVEGNDEHNNVEEVFTEADPNLKLEDLNLEDELEMPETDIESVKEQVIDSNNKNTNELWKLEDISEEYLQGLNDKQIKEICKRENLRVRGTKSEKIDRILKQKNYQVNLN